MQTFPITDDFQFESEKQAAAAYSAKLFDNIAGDYISKLNQAHQPVDQAMGKFFTLVQEHIDNRNGSENSLGQAMEGLLYCSPKRVIAAFQKDSLEAGGLIVCNFNCLIDLLAKEYPRCRSGIFASRLNYSDVIQISEEIISTLRTTSTVLDDVQRRHDLLEALQGDLLADLQSPQIQQIWDAIGATFQNSLQAALENESWWKKILGSTFAPVAWASAVVSAPQAQFQGELARERRIRVFIATSVLLQQGWIEWSRLNQEIVIPNLTVMFNLKSDFVRNRLISITDLITTNGYNLNGLRRKIDSLIQNGNNTGDNTVTGADLRTSQPSPSLNSHIDVSQKKETEVGIGKIYVAKVVKMFENFDYLVELVDFMPGKRGLIPSNELGSDRNSWPAIGTYMTVKCISADGGEIRLSPKVAG